jgi:hypothetical protein
MESLEVFGHGNNLVQASITPTLRFAKEDARRMGHPLYRSVNNLWRKAGPPSRHGRHPADYSQSDSAALRKRHELSVKAV